MVPDLTPRELIVVLTHPWYYSDHLIRPNWKISTQKTMGQPVESNICWYDWSWISSWIKSLSHEFDIPFHVRASKLPSHHHRFTIDCDVITTTKAEQVRHDVDACESSFWSPCMGWCCHVRNRIMYLLSWRTLYALTRGYFGARCFPTREIDTKITLSSAHSIKGSPLQHILYPPCIFRVFSQKNCFICIATDRYFYAAR